MPRKPGDIWKAVTLAKWDLMLPAIILVSFFSGFATVVESSALAVLVAILLECVIHRAIPFRKLLSVMVRCAIITGGIMITLGLAYGLTSYLVDAQTPTFILQWVQAHFHSKAGFLMMLNLFLIFVGSIMNIFSAIAVIAPIIVPIALAYHIHPIHLGIIFLLNLEIGYLTPPAGLNLFYSSYGFGLPINRISRSVIPFQLISLFVLLLVTYLPWLSTWFLR
jgi:C4-dicarboxylate transporter, DctM subunit